MTEQLPVALVTGVGPGTGAAMARRLAAGGYAVAMAGTFLQLLLHPVRENQLPDQIRVAPAW